MKSRSIIVWGMLFLLTTAMPTLAVGAQGEDLDLTRAVQMTLTGHPQAKATQASLEAAGHAWRRAVGAYLPQVDARAAYGPEYSDNPALRESGAGVEDKWNDRRETRISARQLIFDGLGTWDRIQEADEMEKAEAMRLGDVRESLAMSAVQAYLDVLEQREQVRLAQANLDNKNVKMDQVSERMKSGVGVSSDVDQVKSRQEQAHSVLLQAQKRLRDAEAVFMEIVGVRPGDLAAPVAVGEASLPESLDAAQGQTKDAHPAIKRRQHELEAAREALEASEGSFWPRLSIEAGASANHNLEGIKGENDDAQVLGVAEWNLYNGGADWADRMRLLSRQKEARENLAGVVRIVERDVATSWSELERAKENMAHLDQAAMSEESVVGAFEDQFRLNKRSLLDLLNVDDSRYRTQASQIRGRYELLAAQYSLLGSMARIGQTLGVELGQEAQ